MLDINFIRQNPDQVKEGLLSKNSDPKLVDKFLRIDDQWRKKIFSLEQLRSEQNVLNKELAQEKSDHLLARAQILKQRISELKEEIKKLENKRNQILYQFPNLPLPEVPRGRDESENKVIKEVGEKTTFDFEPYDYLDLAEKLDLIDVKRASKVSGPRFGYLKNEAVLLEFALVKYVFDTLMPYGFKLVVPPVMIKEEMMKGMGYVDRSEDQAETYFLKEDKMYLVATSEHSLGPMHANEVFEENELPKRYLAFSTCFRREAGSYGKDTRGIFRVHQFDKLEMFSFTHPEKSKEEHLFLLSLEEKLMQGLKIPYRVVEICSGDLGYVAAAKFDIEAWFPVEKTYRETHSASNVLDFQSRRLNIKFKPRDPKQKLQFVHTLNATALAIGRILIALIENYQTKDGKIKIPEVLQEYLKIKEIG